MLRTCRGLQGYWMGAVDGRMGELKDFYFDDESWTIRYLVLDTSRWLPGRTVLISPTAVQSVEWDAGVLHTDLTQEQISNAPTLAADESVGRQHEADLARYFSWPTYWEGASQDPAMTYYVASGSPRHQRKFSEVLEQAPSRRGDPNLRSMHALIGYRVVGQDDEAGQLDDFVIDDQAWVVRYLVVDVGTWWAGEQVLVHPEWLEDIDWQRSTTRFAATRQAIRTAPRFDPSVPLTREYERELHAHYGRPVYWT